MRASWILALMAILGASPALAQQHPGMPGMAQPKGAQRAPRQAMGGMMGGMQGCMDMMGGPSPAMILQHRQALGLSAQQVERLRALQVRDSTAMMPHMRAAMAAHQAAAELLRADHPDFAAYEARLHEAANHAIAGHVAMARASVEAREVLTVDQRTRLQAAMKTGGRGMMGPGMAGMGGRMQGMGGMEGMMDCPMMGAMHRAGAPAQPHEH